MPAIISDQFRILNAANFVAGVADTSQYYYSFIGLPNSQDIGACLLYTSDAADE